MRLVGAFEFDDPWVRWLGGGRLIRARGSRVRREDRSSIRRKELGEVFVYSEWRGWMMVFIMLDGEGGGWMSLESEAASSWIDRGASVSVVGKDRVLASLMGISVRRYPSSNSWKTSNSLYSYVNSVLLALSLMVDISTTSMLRSSISRRAAKWRCM